MQPQRTSMSVDPVADAHARREALRRRMAEEGITLHLPRPGRRRAEGPCLPVSADELSEAVIRVRRGDL